MTNEPLIVCVMLANGRPEMVRRAIRCYLDQTYEQRRMVIWDTGEERLDLDDLASGILLLHKIIAPRMDGRAYRNASIGRLRNEANEYAGSTCHLWGYPDYVAFAHWDSDDWSHPRRLEEQAAFLVESGRPCVGYNKMLFWDTTPKRQQTNPASGGEAWLYSNENRAQPLGTSLMYLAETWKQNKFQDFTPSSGAEDVRFLNRLKPFATSCDSLQAGRFDMPRMIAAIHGANTSSCVTEAAAEWIRVPEYDQICSETMELSC